MFNKLKEKLKSWTEKLSKKEETEEIEETEKKVIPEKISKEIKKKESKKTEDEKVKEKVEKTLEELPKKKIEDKEKEIEQLKEEINQKKKVQEEIEEKSKPQEEIQAIEEEKSGFFSKIKESVKKVTQQKVTISEEDFEIYGEELEMLLLENNVAFEVSEKIVKELKEKIVGKELLKKEIEFEIHDSLKEIIREILIEPFEIKERIAEKKKSSKEPFVILFCGINGTGKTTSIAKIAESLKKEGISCVLAAGDTFRAASIEQLKHHGDKIGIPVVAHDYNSDPASVGFDAIQYAKKHAVDAVLIDTAGRMYTEKNLMKEIEKISKVTKPDVKIFVGESITGNDAIEQAKSFNWAIGIDGIILSKADIDEKGGTALSVGFVTKKPILYLGIGQNYGDVEKFDKEKFIERLGL